MVVLRCPERRPGRASSIGGLGVGRDALAPTRISTEGSSALLGAALRPCRQPPTCSQGRVQLASFGLWAAAPCSCSRAGTQGRCAPSRAEPVEPPQRLWEQRVRPRPSAPGAGCRRRRGSRPAGSHPGGKGGTAPAGALACPPCSCFSVPWSTSQTEFESDHLAGDSPRALHKLGGSSFLVRQLLAPPRTGQHVLLLSALAAQGQGCEDREGPCGLVQGCPTPQVAMHGT